MLVKANALTVSLYTYSVAQLIDLLLYSVDIGDIGNYSKRERVSHLFCTYKY